MYGPHVAILLMCVSRNTRRVYFHGLTGSQRTPRFGVSHRLIQFLMLITGLCLFGSPVGVSELIRIQKYL